MEAATAPAEDRPQEPAPWRARIADLNDRVRARIGLDLLELAMLLALAALSMVPLTALLLKGRPLSGADGFLATDQLQYLAWIREASHHVLIGNPWDLAPGHRVFLHPIMLVSAGLHVVLGISIPLSYLAWKPVAVGVTFVGALFYVRRLLPTRGARHAGLALALFAVAPAAAFVAFTGVGGKPRQYTFDFISGEMWTGQYLWGYLPTAIAVFTLPLVLLGLERWRTERRTKLLVWSTAGAVLVAWLQPWQGGELLLIVWGVELLRWRRRVDPVRPSGWILGTTTLAVGVPGLYYLILSHVDPGWELAGKSNQAGAQDLWAWPWWAIVLVLLPLALPAAFAYRRGSARDWQSMAVRLWPAAVLLVYLQPFGTFPYHSFQGLQLPLAILAVLGVRSVWPRISWPWVVAILVVMVVPGTIHKATVFENSVKSGGDPYYVFPGEVALLKHLEHDPRAGGVLGPTYAELLIPARTGREAYVGPFSWTPDWQYRAEHANDLFEGRLTGAAARRFVIQSRARWLFADCRPLDLPALEKSIAPLLARPPQHFGCATLYELKERPDMLAAAGPPDS